MRLLALLLLSVIPLVSSGQKEDLNPRDPRLNEGTMFAIRFVPASRQVVVSLVGKPMVRVDPERVIVFGQAVGKSGKTSRLTIKPTGEQFTIMESLDSAKAVELEVQDRMNKEQKESFRFDLR